MNLATASSGVSFVIPNYNGQKLLAKHLPSVLTAARSGDELVIIDDCSTDASWSWLCEEFSAEKISPSDTAFDGEVALGSWKKDKKKGPVQLLRNHTNQRFAISCNRAVELATQPLIFLLNSDVSPHQRTVEKLVTHFADKKLFAVGCLEFEKNPHNAKEPLTGGKNQLEFARGMFIHRRANDFSTGETAWASGGSAMFDRQKWLALGGFDADYSPAYWEDVDLSFRAKKHGWKVLFDHDATVDHNHESTNTTEFGQKKMNIMSWQHAHTFVHKHATFWQRLQYFLYQPYWWVKMPYYSFQQLQFLFFLTILLLAIVSRGYQLGAIPHGMTWDEAAIGYNGHAVATTGRDEWLKKLPLSFQSFGDYKAPLAIYITGVSTLLFGVNLTAIRLPFMVSSIFATLGMMASTYILWTEWFPRPKVQTQEDLQDGGFPQLSPTSAALLAGAIMATSSWHVHYSRIGFESGMALGFLLCGVASILWLCWQKLNVPWVQRILIGGFAAGCFAASLYTYHSSKIVAPLLLMVIAVLYRRLLVKNIPLVVLWGGALFLLLTPLLYDSVIGKGGERFLQTNIFSRSETTLEALSIFATNTAAHFSPSYVINGATTTLRHGDGRFGILYLTEALLCLTAVVAYVGQLAKKKTRDATPHGLFLLATAWILIGILPAAIGIDVPHSNRMMLALPGYVLLSVLGWQSIAKAFRKTLWAPAILGTLVMLHFLLFSTYIHHYYTVFAKASAADFIDGSLQAAEYAVKHEDSVDKVIFTSTYQQPLIYLLIARKTKPFDLNMGAMSKYYLSGEVSPRDLRVPNTLVIGTPQELPVDQVEGEELVYGSDGSIRFVMVKTSPAP